ncbi:MULTISPECIES: hypothetical protein [unclassified Kribbella]|uniref:hypothetical protein n=1 Tax=unclassified Kribbella TaxID=2644121 RepID=UPI0033D14333
MPKSIRPACAAAVLVLALAACSGGGDAASSSPSTAASPTPVPSTATPPATTPSVVPPSSPAAKPVRTAAQLAKALLALEDLPAGFSIETGDSGEDGDVTLASKDPRCARLVTLSNADTLPGSKASATKSYSGGAQGPFIDESLDALGSTAAVQAFQKSFKQAVAACRTMTLSIPGEGRSPISVREVSAPRAGTDPVAVRFTASSGPLEGLEVTMISTGIDDVVLAVTVVAGVPEDIDGATTTAADKATSVLAATQSGT